MIKKYTKKGYLEDQFRYSHLKNTESTEFDTHYHDFNKIIIFLSGKVSYMIDGIFYFLEPGDILFIHQYDIHRPIIDSAIPYERVVIWLSDYFLKTNSMPDESLCLCFDKAVQNKSHLLRLSAEKRSFCRDIIHELDKSYKIENYGRRLLAHNLLVNLLINLNLFSQDPSYFLEEAHHNTKTEQIITYINEHLTSDLSVDHLAEKFYTSKYYMMRRFKSETGFTLHGYILQKRLSRAASSLRCGASVTDAYLTSGFKEYSTFLRAFKKMFHVTPTDYH